MRGVRTLSSTQRLGLLVGAFLLTRLILAGLAASPDIYGSSYAQVTTDIELYESWAYDMVVLDRSAYSNFPFEYPPASVPFVALPAAGQDSPDDYTAGLYTPRFITLMLLVDVAGFAGLWILARRWKSDFGLWTWIAGIFFLGPIAYARLDLVPAVATIWAIERAAAGSWFGAGGWLGFGTLAKVYPAFLAPVMFFISPRRKSLVVGFLLVTALLLLPYAGNLGDLFSSVVGFHAERGVHVESLWGTILVLASKLGLDAEIALSYGAFHVESWLSPTFKTLGSLAAIIVVAAGARMAQRDKDGPPPRPAVLMFGTMALLLGVGTVFSPQFLIWLVALGAAASCYPNSSFRGVVLLLVPIAVFTQMVYPFIYEQIVSGNLYAILFLTCRNLLVIVAGVSAFMNVRATAPRVTTEPSVLAA